MELDLRPLHPDFGAEIRSVDLSNPLEEGQFADVASAVERYSVVLFRGQSLDDDSQLAFSRRFGELEYGHLAYGRDGSIEYIGRIGNIDKDGAQLPAKHRKVVFSTGNEMWHTDSSFREVPARLSISYAYEVTPDGGELEFVSTRPAYARAAPGSERKDRKPCRHPRLQLLTQQSRQERCFGLPRGIPAARAPEARTAEPGDR